MEDRLQRLVAERRHRVDADEPSPTSLSHAPRSYLRTLVKEAGYERQSPRLLEDLETRLRDAGLGTFPELTDPTNTRDTPIYFFDLEHPIPGVQPTRALFDDEAQLQRFLTMNFAILKYVQAAQLRFLGREVRLSANCIVDVLAEVKRTRELVAFELKVREPGERIVAQATKYIDALARRADRESRCGARLLIVTGQPDPNLEAQVQELAATRGVEVEWLLYTVEFKLHKSSSKS